MASPSPKTPTIDELSFHTGWVRELARSLVQDPHLAEDLAQATCVAAIEHAAADGTLSRGWLATVLRNFLRQHLRRERDRPHRERALARTETLPSPDQMLSKIHAHRRVVEAVLALKEPYRTVILWRFFEGLAPQEIADRRHVPVGTVNSQLQRALQKLRSRLDGEFGHRRSWLLALAPALQATKDPTTTITSSVSSQASKWALVSGVMAMKVKLIGSLAAAALLLVATSVFLLDEESREDRGATPSGSNAAHLRGSSTAAPNDSTRAARSEVGDEPRVSDLPRPSIQPPTPTPQTLRGRVYDLEGRPLQGVLIGTAQEGTQTVTSDAHGHFLHPMPRTKTRLHVLSEGWTTVVAGILQPGDPDQLIEPIIFAAKAIHLSGVVVSESGNPVEGASVICSLPSDFTVRVNVSTDASQPLHPTWRTVTDDRGRFDLPPLGQVPGATLVVRKTAYLPSVEPQPQTSTDSLTIELLRPQAESSSPILGQVLDPYGRPLPGAHVTLGKGGTTSDQGGLFRLSRERAAGHVEVRVLKRGFLPRSVKAPPPSKEPPEFLYIQLDNPPLSIRGRVIDPEGNPISGVRLWVKDPEVVSGLENRLATVEGFLSGGLTADELRVHSTEDEDSLNQAMYDRPTCYWGWTKTGPEGGFELGGLQERSYVLRCFDEKEMTFFDAGPFDAGQEGIRIVYQPKKHETVGGHVVGLDGTPVQGVEVQLCVWTLRLDVTHPDGTTSFTGDAYDGPITTTDARGYFRFKGVGRGSLWLTLNADHIMSRVVGMDSPLGSDRENPIDRLRLEVTRRLHVRLELANPEIADAMAIVDANGEHLSLVLFEGEGRKAFRTVTVHEGQTRVYAVSERAREAILYREGEELLRLPLDLRDKTVNIIRG